MRGASDALLRAAGEASTAAAAKGRGEREVTVSDDYEMRKVKSMEALAQTSSGSGSGMKMTSAQGQSGEDGPNAMVPNANGNTMAETAVRKEAVNDNGKRSRKGESEYHSDSLVPVIGKERKKGVPWTEDEHRLFLLGLQKLGKGDWRGISRHFVQTRTPTQVASHAQKYFIRQTNMSKRKRRSSLFDLSPDLGMVIPAAKGSGGGVQDNNTAAKNNNNAGVCDIKNLKVKTSMPPSSKANASSRPHGTGKNTNNTPRFKQGGAVDSPHVPGMSKMGGGGGGGGRAMEASGGAPMPHQMLHPTPGFGHLPMPPCMPMNPGMTAGAYQSFLAGAAPFQLSQYAATLQAMAMGMRPGQMGEDLDRVQQVPMVGTPTAAAVPMAASPMATSTTTASPMSAKSGMSPFARVSGFGGDNGQRSIKESPFPMPAQLNHNMSPMAAAAHFNPSMAAAMGPWLASFQAGMPPWPGMRMPPGSQQQLPQHPGMMMAYPNENGNNVPICKPTPLHVMSDGTSNLAVEPVSPQ